VRAFIALGAAVLVAGLLAGAATPRPAKAPAKLTAAEKNALRITSVEAVGVRKRGLIVVVTFKGNIERALGRGHLGDAAVALLLTSPGSKRPTAGLVAYGAGAVGTTLRKAVGKRSGIARDGRQLTFVVGGPVIPTDEITIKSFPSVLLGAQKARRTAVRAEDPPTIEKERWEVLNDAIDEAEKSIEADGRLVDGADCLVVAQIVHWATFASGRAAEDRDKLLGIEKRLGEVIAGLDKSGGKPTDAELDKIDRVVEEFLILRGEARRFNREGTLLRELRRMVREVKKLAARENSLVKAFDGLAVTAKLEDPPCSIRAVFSQADRATTYSWDSQLGLSLREWVLLPPANDPKCNNRGKLKESGEKFSWYHGDDVCDHTKEDPATGHIGVVTVTVASLNVRCKSVYFGTFSGTGPKGSCEETKKPR
jgi:hypothetical protein